MRITTKESPGCLDWLKGALGDQREAVTGLMRRLTAFNMSRDMKSSAFCKFMKTLEQVSIEKDIECEIIGKIQAVELHHRHQRKCKNLKSATADIESWKSDESENDEEPEISDNGWLSVMAIIDLISRRGPEVRD